MCMLPIHKAIYVLVALDFFSKGRPVVSVAKIFDLVVFFKFNKTLVHMYKSLKQNFKSFTRISLILIIG